MCLLHDQEEYGIARWPLKEIAQAIGCTVQKLRGLVTKGVIKGADAGQKNESLVYVPRSGRKEGPAVTLINPQEGPIWFSSRMVIDEYKRVLRGEYGATPKVTPDHSPKGGIGATPKPTPDPSPSRAHASSSSSSSSSVNPEVIASGVHDPNVGTPGGAVCARLKSDGIIDVNPMHPRLLALLEAGLTVEEIAAVGPEAKEKGKGFHWILATAEGRRRDASNVKKMPERSAVDDRLSPAGRSTAEAAKRWLESQEATA
jgi:hypothetical protein